MRSYSTTIADEDGVPIGLVAGMSVVDDLVEAREKAEAIAQQLTESEQRFRLLAENMTDIVLHTKDHVVQWASPSLTHTLGWLPSEWVGHSVREFIHADDHALVASTRDAAMRGEDVVARARVLEPSGAYVWVEAHLAGYRNDQGAIDGVVVSIRVQGTPVIASRGAESPLQ